MRAHWPPRPALASSLRRQGVHDSFGMVKYGEVNDFYSAWAKWFFADRHTRRVSPWNAGDTSQRKDRAPAF
jgi:hypothetical protein